jgi:pyruvate/2-oxoglutarate dehydrogenase complex dihydrolipoamide acyltransferase (E2) component
MRRFMPYVSPRRNDSAFYMFQDIEVEAALEYLEKKNRERPPERPITLFHLFLRACAHAIHARPGVNRFVKGGRLWQRDGVWLTFSAKREIRDGSPMITVKRRFHPADESLEQMVDAIYEKLARGRSGRKTTSDKEVGLLLRLPGPLIRLLLGLHQLADRFGLLPRAMIDPDPLYTSLFVANLGSINYPAGFHHLWEYGTASMFGVMGRIEPGANGRRTMRAAWTYDERIEDGLYSYYTLELIRERIETPELLEAPADEPEGR